MPNWCNNIFQIQHDNPAMIDRFVKAFLKCATFEEFIPAPTNLFDDASFDDDADSTNDSTDDDNILDLESYCEEHWGTKWDVGIKENCGSIEIVNDNTAIGVFESPWAPPIAGFSSLHKQHGFKFSIKYNEPMLVYFAHHPSVLSDRLLTTRIVA